MKILSVKINNILSIEDAYVEFDDTGLMLVQGFNHDVGRANGAGKTAIFNAITFALYDKLPRKVTATEIIRRGSKAGSVEVTLEVNSRRYLVQRCRPKGVNFYEIINGLGGSEERSPVGITQEGFEAILRMNYVQFMLCMYCAQGTSTRFLSINDSEKKQFLLQLLNLEEFSSCKLIADGKVKNLQDEFAALKSRTDAIDSKVDAYQESLVDENVYKHAIDLANASLASMLPDLAYWQNVTKPDLSKYQKVENDVNAKRLEFAKAKAQREMFHIQYRKLNARLSPFNASAECSECGGALDNSSAEARHKQEQESLRRELSSLKDQINACEAVFAKEQQVNDLFDKVKHKKKVDSAHYDKASSQSSDLLTKIALKQKEVAELNLKLQNNSELEQKINGLLAERKRIFIEGANILREIEIYKTVSVINSPVGAQAYVLDSVIESFNERVAEYVAFLWSNMTYELKSYKETVKGDLTAKFSESLIMDGKPISIGSMSGGEFRALSLCVDFALVDVMERMFGISLSPIILDEPFDGLDGAGREYIVELLGKFSRDRLVVVVDHANEVKSMFSKVISVEKRSGVSTVSLQT